MSGIRITSILLLAIFIAGCTSPSPSPTPSPAPSPSATTPPTPDTQGLSAESIATLSSLEQVDDYPLYTLHYFSNYSQPVPPNTSQNPAFPISLPTSSACNRIWGCALFAALGNPGSRVYGRNYDWHFSPAVLLFTDPPDGYASVSMVDMEYLDFEADQLKDLLNLSIKDRQPLLDAPTLPFDGMNERGLAIGMAAVPPGDMETDPNKPTIDELAVMREILDHAASVDEAINLLSSYNIVMSTIPLHYLVASAAGESALIEFYQGKMIVYRNEEPWQIATNFLVASTGGKPEGQCPRFDRIARELQAAEGRLNNAEAIQLLSDVSQAAPVSEAPTQWSVVYDLSSGDITIVMGRKYSNEAHKLHLDLVGS